MSEPVRDQIIRLLKEKSVMKQDVFKNTIEVFEDLKKCIKQIGDDLSKEVEAVDKRVTLECKFTGDYQAEMKVAGDMLVFFMHTNVFEFDKSHPMFKTGYIKDNEYNSYCGIIYVYNFLADSFKFNRLSDSGHLIARIFINREKKFFLEARPPLGYKYANFSTQAISDVELKEIVMDLTLFAITFDLMTPPAEMVREISVNELFERVQSDKMRTGKRLGFRFQSEDRIGDAIG